MTVERLELGPNTSLQDVVERVREDKVPRVIEQDGEALAVVISPEQFGIADAPTSKRRKDQLLSLAGAWSDLDVDEMIEDLYRRRSQSPPSHPLGA